MKTTEKSRLIDEIEASLANRDYPLWFPELSPKLARAAWESLRRDVGLAPHNYGTARVLAHDPTAPRTVFARLPVPRPSNGPEPHLLVELLEGSAARRYEELRLDFATGDEIANTRALDCIREAMSILARLPSLRDTLFQLVKVIHILRAQGDEYDVSHSDPVVPFSVFVSVPKSPAHYNSMRVAESIVHEAMHLQLTLIERAGPLVMPSLSRYFSPWKKTYRAPAGVLHGLYVFRVIESYLERQSLAPSDSKKLNEYIHKRRRQICAEIQEVTDFGDCPDLTELGNLFANMLISTYPSLR